MGQEEINRDLKQKLRILHKRKPLTQKDKEFMNRPYHWMREDVRGSTLNTKPESLKKFGEHFDAYRNKDLGVVYIIGDNGMWILRCPQCTNWAFTAIFEGNADLEKMGWIKQEK